MSETENDPWEVLARDLGDVAKDVLQPIAKEAGADVKEFGRQIGKDMVVALRSGREDLKDELVEQARLLAQIQGIRVEKASWDFAERALKLVFRAALAAVKAGVVP